MNNKGIISTTLVYSFFIVFILFMIAIVMSLSNKVFLLKKVEQSAEEKMHEDLENVNICSPGDNLSDCLFKSEYFEYLLGNSNIFKSYNSVFESLNTTEDFVSNIKIKIDNKTGPNFNLPSTTEEGMYYAQDNYGKSYYYRGNEDDNYLEFAGLTWRIVRINGNGSIRIILEDNSNISKYEEPEYGWLNKKTKKFAVGFMHIEKALLDANTWFASKDNLINSDILNYLNTFYDTKIDNNHRNYIDYEESYFYGDKEAITDSSIKTNLAKNFCMGFNLEINEDFCAKFSIASWVRNGATFYFPLNRSINNSPSLTRSDSYSIYKYSSDYSITPSDRLDNCEKQCKNTKNNCDASCESKYSWLSNERKNCKNGCDNNNDSCKNQCKNTSSIGYLKYPIGLITVDELILSGMNFVSEKETTYDSKSFLTTNKNNAYWTMSTGFVDKNLLNREENNGIFEYLYDYQEEKTGIYYFVSGEGGKIQLSLEEKDLKVRPVINLKKEVKYCSGNGTKDSPYQISNGSGGCVN